MAESEGFEPPIDLRLCLISSQVHSTGLCQLSAFVTYHLSAIYDRFTLDRFRRRTIWSVLCPSSSATVRRSTPAITSLLAKVWRLQCHVYPSIFASSNALGNQPRDLEETRQFGPKGALML